MRGKFSGRDPSFLALSLFIHSGFSSTGAGLSVSWICRRNGSYFAAKKIMFHHLGKAVISVVWPLNSIILHQAVVKSTLKLDKYYQARHNQLITNSSDTFASGCHRCGGKQ